MAYQGDRIMNKKELDLLRKDLCARLPYAVTIYTQGDIHNLLGVFDNTIYAGYDMNNYDVYPIEDVKPCLRRLSDMSRPEKELIKCLISADYIDDEVVDFGEYICDGSPIEIDKFTIFIDWLNAHNFDHRGLIDKGLALDYRKIV